MDSLELLNIEGPQVSVVNISTDLEWGNENIGRQNYRNCELANVESSKWLSELVEYIDYTQSEYLCFIRKKDRYDANRIGIMLQKLEEFGKANCDLVICNRNYVNEEGEFVARPNTQYQESLEDKIFMGRDLLGACFGYNTNLYGNISTIFISMDYMRACKDRLLDSLEPDDADFYEMNVIWNIMKEAKTRVIFDALCDTPLIKEDKSEIFKEYISQKSREEGWSDFSFTEADRTTSEAISCDKQITFFYTVKGEYYNLQPLEEEAKRRGYTTKFTSDIREKAEIGIYCQHLCYPDNSKFSVILLHDMLQGHNRWPNFWEKEPWSKFDIGILPGKAWADRWSQCAFLDYVNPRCGAFELGYPKSDYVNSKALQERAEYIKNELKLKYDTTILYAPSWENDGKEDDFVEALRNLPVNLLIKQAHWNEAYASVIANIKQMRELHEGKYDNVYYIEPEESIMTALALADLVVSEESSVMAEAYMFGKASIAVYDWLIPDTVPSRYASVPMDFVLKCKKVQLYETVERFLDNPDSYKGILDNGKKLFSNIGNVCNDIMDAIEYYANTDGMGKEKKGHFMSLKLDSLYNSNEFWG